MRRMFFAALSLLLVQACGHPEGAVKHYQLSGRVVSLDSSDRVATIDTAAIPNWMEAMTMEYPVKNPSDFNRLRVGASIKATLNVRGPGDYDLTNIQPQSPVTAK